MQLVGRVSALKIHMSENAHLAVKAFPEFHTESRGEIFIKVNRWIHFLSLKVLFPYFQSLY